MSKQELSDLEKRKLLYTYWNDLPFIKRFDSESYTRLEQSKIKRFVIKYIRDGVEDEFGKNHNLSRRHAFSAKELHEAYEMLNNERYSISNFHFHIKRLVNEGYLQKIAKFLEGYQYQNYYGRTAKIFLPLFDIPLSSKYNELVFNPLKNLIKKMNPEIEENYVDELILNFLKLSEDFYFRVFSWMKANHKLVYESKLDLALFTDMVGVYSIFHAPFSENIQKIGSLIGLDKILSYERYKFEEQKKNEK